MNYQHKYLKYKNKYLSLKNKVGGDGGDDHGKKIELFTIDNLVPDSVLEGTNLLSKNTEQAVSICVQLIELNWSAN